MGTGGPVIETHIPVKTVSEANNHAHWRYRARRARAQRHTTRLALSSHLARAAVALPCVVSLTRLSTRTLDDDNLRGSLKHVRDEVAAWLGVNDADPVVQYKYGQAVCKRGSEGVRVEVHFGARLVESITGAVSAACPGARHARP